MKRNLIRQNVLPVLAAMIWGSAFIAQSVGAEHMGPCTFNTARSIVAFFFLLGLCAVRRRFWGSAVRSWRELLAAGGCCGTALAVATWLQQAGMATTEPGKAGFITALYIVIVPLIGKFFLRRQAPSMIWISVALAAAGLYLLSVTEALTIEPGDVYMILCALVFSVQILLIDHFSRRVDGVAMSCVQFFTMTVISALGAFVTAETISAEALRVCLWAILYAGILSSGVAYTLQILAQKDSNPMVVSLLLSLESVFAALSGALFRHERMTGRKLLGCALMFAGVVIAQIPRRDALESAWAGCYNDENVCGEVNKVRIEVLGVGFDNITREEAVQAALSLIERGGTHYVVTPNPEIVEVCREREEVARAVNGADLVLPDGIGVIKGAAILGTPLRERVPGIEFAGSLLERLAKTEHSIYFLGGKPGVAEQAAENLSRRYPGLRRAGTHDGYFSEDAPVAEEIRRSGADVVFVCLGAPKQELWMSRNGADTGAKLLCGLGGSLDVFAGVAKRAPAFFCDHGLEWFYRLCKEPWRWKRMLKLPVFLFHVRQEKRGRKRNRNL